jgi:hypothetical protein
LKQNNTIMFARLREFMPLAVSLALLTACSSNPFRSEQADGGKQGRIITVTSSPAGASVRANGNKLGETPLEVNIDKSIPSKWMRAEDYGIVYRVSGKLTLEKNGCEDFTIPVSPQEPADDVNVTLVCTEQKPAPRAVETVKPAVPESMQQRLKKLEKLYREGVISSDEYEQHRNRILGEL